MKLLDYGIIAAVVALFALALKVFIRKPGCSCGKSDGCSGNCAACGGKCGHSGK